MLKTNEKIIAGILGHEIGHSIGFHHDVKVIGTHANGSRIIGSNFEGTNCRCEQSEGQFKGQQIDPHINDGFDPVYNDNLNDYRCLMDIASYYADGATHLQFYSNCSLDTYRKNLAKGTYKCMERSKYTTDAPPGVNNGNNDRLTNDGNIKLSGWNIFLIVAAVIVSMVMIIGMIFIIFCKKKISKQKMKNENLKTQKMAIKRAPIKDKNQKIKKNGRKLIVGHKNKGRM